jgi:hypothetical protein
MTPRWEPYESRGLRMVLRETRDETPRGCTPIQATFVGGNLETAYLAGPPAWWLGGKFIVSMGAEAYHALGIPPDQSPQGEQKK